MLEPRQRRENSLWLLPDAERLRLTFEGHESFTDYRREFDLRTAVARVAYCGGPTRFARGMFAKAPDQVLVLRLTTDQPTSLTFSTTSKRPERAPTEVEGADAVPLLISAATEYRPETPHYRGNPDEQLSARPLEAAAAALYLALRERHVTNHRALIERVELDLTRAGADERPTDERLSSRHEVPMAGRIGCADETLGGGVP